MTERIEKLTELTLKGDMYVEPIKTEFDREDLFLSKIEKETKQLCEFILNQEPKLTPYSKMTGFFRFDWSVVGDAFQRAGHKATEEAMNLFYLKPVDGLSTMEWQHATADYKKVLNIGLEGIKREIDDSVSSHSDAEETEYLKGLKRVADALIGWAHKCSKRALEFAETVENEKYKENLKKLSAALLKVPEKPASSFYEAVLCIYLCYSADPDSVGVLDRYLWEFYKKDIDSGKITRDVAKEYLQELFLMLQAKTSVNAYQFTRGGESHFCVGGYLENGEDGFTELSRFIVESLMELPVYCPQITLRWTKKTPREVFRYMMDCERNDKFKRIAFTNDEKRIKCYTEICGFPYERAVNYTTVGCNEPAFTGTIVGSNSKINILRCVDRLFKLRAEELIKTKNFDEFYAIFEQELFADYQKGLDYDDKYNLERAKDLNYVSTLLMKDCIENAKSPTRGGGDYVVAGPTLQGITNVIDSLIVVKQFVFEEKRFTMEELIKALKANWEGAEDMRALILKKGHFFGNDDDLSNGVAQRLYRSFYEFLKDKTNVFGYHWLVGDLVGYNIHHVWFGETMGATPDGRFAGEPTKFGIGQSEGKDREGLTALLNSIAKLDPNAIACGSTVTNVNIEAELIRNDEYFEKTVDMFETYLKNGGVHFQLTYVSKEDLLAAKKTPENYGGLRVRVSGFSENFVKLKEELQDEVILRTIQK